MQINSYSTPSLSAKTLSKSWIVIDAQNHPLGRLASIAALHLIGKHRPDYTPNMDCGDYVIIINASKIQLTGRKWDRRLYFQHTGYPGSQRRVSARHIFDKDPTRLVGHAIRGMLPSNRLGRAQGRHLHIYASTTHTHEAQQPTLLSI